MRKIKKKHLLLLLCAALLLGAGAVAADESIGTVDVVPETPSITNVVLPSSVDPEIASTLTFTLVYNTGLEDGASVWVHLYKDGYAADLDYVDAPSSGDLENHYWARWFNIPDGGWWDQSDVSRITNVIGPDGPDMPIIDGSPIDLGLDVTFHGLATYGLWHLRIGVLYASETLSVEHDQDFDMNARVAVLFTESTFSFGDIEQGEIAIVGIQDPVSGYLTVTLTSNVPSFVQLSGTDPDDGLGNIFSVGNIIQNSIDDSVGAIPLSGTLTNLEGIGEQPAGEYIFEIHLWIAIPVGTPISTYEFVLSCLAVAA